MPPSPKPLVGTFRSGSRHTVGDGFPVRNLFPSNDLGARLSPFLLLDYAGPAEMAPTDRPRGVGEHPHRGFETVTLCYQGRVAHRDSAGNRGVIGPGDVQWMTAGDGVVHEERHEAGWAAEGGTLQLVQLWVDLPRDEKRTPPRYQDLRAEDFPRLGRDGVRLRVVAGEVAGLVGPARTRSPVELADARIEPGATLELALPGGHNAGAVVLTGRARVNGSPALGEAEMAWLGAEGESLRVEAEEETHVLVLAGEPLDQPVVSHGPFVMTSEAEVLEAIRDYRAGRMGRL